MSYPARVEGLGKYVYVKVENCINSWGGGRYINVGYEYCWYTSYFETCTCTHMYVFVQYFFINAYFIVQYIHVLSTYFCLYPFELPNWFYCDRWDLVDETLITNCYPFTFCLILGYHQGCVYCKSNLTFACTLLFCKCLLFILVCCSVLFISFCSGSS